MAFNQQSYYEDLFGIELKALTDFSTVESAKPELMLS
ncbi:hypothetical protein C7M52_00670 [Mixta theicola]|nr:hypothetical protein C7M52_00670 [Mixta theicola]